MERLWSDERIRQTWLEEVEARFEAENAGHRAMEARDLAKLAEDGRIEALPEHMRAPSNSALYQLWCSSTVSVEGNSARVVMPAGWSIPRDFITMFESTEMGWSTVALLPVMVGGDPHISLEVTLVDSWDDLRRAAWRGNNGVEVQRDRAEVQRVVEAWNEASAPWVPSWEDLS